MQYSLSKIYRHSWFPISIIAIVATILYAYKLNSFPLTTDELYSIYDAKELKIFYYRPLYFIILHIWMYFGTSDGWLRSLSILFELGSIFSIYQLSRCLLEKNSERIGSIAAVLITLSPLLIQTAQQVRMYTLGNFLTILGAIALVNLSKNPTIKSIGFWAAFRFLALLTIPLSVPILLADFIIVLVKFRKQRSTLLKIGVGFLGIVILWIPFAIALVATKSYYESTWGASTKTLSVMQVVRNIKFFTFWHRRSATNSLIANFHRIFTTLLALVLGMGLLRARRNSGLFWVAAWCFIPLFSLIVIAKTSILSLSTRYLMFISPFFFILLAIGFVRIWDSQRIVGVVLAIAYLIAVSGGIEDYYSHLNGTVNWRDSNVEISLNEQPEDIITVSIPHGRICPFVTHYYQGDAPIYKLNKIRGIVNSQDLDKFVQTMPTSRTRVWLLFRKAFKGTFEDLEIAIKKRYEILSEQYFNGGIKVFLLKPRLTENRSQTNDFVLSSTTFLNCVRNPKIVLFNPLSDANKD